MPSLDDNPADFFSIKNIGLLVTVVTALSVGIVTVSLGLTTGIRALYAVFGSVLFLTGVVSKRRLHIDATANRVSKLLVTVAVFALFISYVLSRVVGLAVLTLGLLILAWTVVYSNFSPRRNIAHTLLLFFSVTTSKFVSTNAYFGNGDMIGHRAAIPQIIAGGPSAITRGVYSDFPGLHALAAVVRVVTGLSPYVALVTVGIVAMSLSVLVVFLIYSEYISIPQIAIAATVLYATFEQTVFYATYVFPQTLAVVLGLLLLLVLSYIRESEKPGEYTLIATLFAASSIVTHHFTLILFAPIVGLFVLTDFIQTVRNRFTPKTVLRGVGLSLWLGIAGIYWQSTKWGLNAITWAIDRLPFTETVASLFADSSSSDTTGSSSVGSSNDGVTTAPADSAAPTTAPTDSAAPTTAPTDSAAPTTAPTDPVPPTDVPSEPSTALDVVWGPMPDFTFGVSVVTDTLPRAVLALVEPTLVYQTALVALVLLGVVVARRSQFALNTDRVLLLILSAGALLLTIRTPIQPKGIERIQMAWGAFVVAIPAVGIGRVITGESGSSFNRVVLAVVLTLAVVSGPLAAADDTTAFQPSVDRNKEVELAHDEQQLRAVAAFGSRTGAELSSPWVTHMFTRWEGSPVGTVVASERGLRPESSLLIVRERWSTQIVKLAQGDSIVLKNAYFSRQSIKRAESNSQKVYTAGDVSVLFAPNRTVTFGAEE